MRHVLEGSKLFPIVAWVLIISFSLFTFALARTLQEESGQLSERTSATVNMLERTP